MSDQTTGHSKGKWEYFGDTFAGICTDCQHSYTPTEEDNSSIAPRVWASHEHEADDIIPPIEEKDFELLRDQGQIDTKSWEEHLANLRLMALARQAPHDCGDPECPGVINKRKLELYDKFQYAIKAFAKEGLLT